MRTLLLFLCLSMCISGKAQNKGIKTHYTSFYGREFIFGTSVAPIYKTVEFSIDTAVLFVNTGKLSSWPLQLLSEYNNEGDIIKHYSTQNVNGLSVDINLVYEEGELSEIVFLQGFHSYHFYITYPHAI